MDRSAAVVAPMVAVPRLWPGETVAILASGPSLTQEDADYCRGRAHVIAVNTSYQRAPDCEVIWATDAKWWKWQQGLPDFQGLKYSLEHEAARWPGVQVLRHTGVKGLERSPTAVRTGRNGGYAAINCAVHLGASRIILLGFDMQRGPAGAEHWHADHPNRSRSPYDAFRPYFETLVEPLKALSVEVINCSRQTALTCFPRMSVQEALP